MHEGDTSPDVLSASKPHLANRQSETLCDLVCIVRFASICTMAMKGDARGNMGVKISPPWDHRFNPLNPFTRVPYGYLFLPHCHKNSLARG